MIAAMPFRAFVIEQYPMPVVRRNLRYFSVVVSFEQLSKTSVLSSCRLEVEDPVFGDEPEIIQGALQAIQAFFELRVVVLDTLSQRGKFSFVA